MRGQSKEQTSLEEPQKNPVGRGLAPAALCCRVSPCGASYFAHGGKVTKTPPGTAQDERSALKFAFPRPLYEGYPLNQAKNFRRAKSEWLFAFPSAPLGLAWLKISNSAISYPRLALPNKRAWFKTQTPHPPPSGAPSPKGEGFEIQAFCLPL